MHSIPRPARPAARRHGGPARRRWFARLAACALAGGAFVALPATGQNYPSKPIRIMVPFGAGGAVDIVARAIGQELGKRLGQPVIVENRIGGGANIASDYVAKSPPDGHTLLMSSPGNAINATLYPKLTYNPATDFTQIALIAAVPTVLLVAPGFPAKDVKEILAMAKAKPGSLTFASGGIGTSEHLAGEMIKAVAGIDLLHVPYKGGAPAMNDLMGGQVALMFTNQLNALPHVKSGKLRAIGMASARRSAALPDVPTFAELGLPQFEISVWWGLMGPAGLPREITARLNQEVNASLASPEMKERLAALSAEPIGGSAEQFAGFFAAEIKRWGEVVRRSGAKAE